MLEARIVSSTGSLYFAGNMTAHDFESLRAHVRDLGGVKHEVRVEMSVDDAGWARLQTSGWLHALATAGAYVSRASAP
jgi:hypothetical protein